MVTLTRTYRALRSFLCGRRPSPVPPVVGDAGKAMERAERAGKAMERAERAGKAMERELTIGEATLYAVAAKCR